jgi:transposase InsO family protein
MKTTKQAFHQYHDRVLNQLSIEADLRTIIGKVRADHPTMGCRDMYFLIQPEGIGRDRFEDFCRQEGFLSSRVLNFRKTTNSTGVIRFDNFAEGLTITGLNQLWVSDITYFEVSGRFYYITCIQDVYSRRIIGYQTSNRLKTTHTSIPALQMAIKLRLKQGQDINNLVFHSDGGGQYYSKEFTDITSKYSFINSMCVYPWENPYAERINGVIKNNYLIHKGIKTFEGLKKEVDRTVKLYNEKKPHKGLKRLTPVDFENNIFANSNMTDGEESTENKNLEPARKSPAGCSNMTSGLRCNKK